MLGSPGGEHENKESNRARAFLCKGMKINIFRPRQEAEYKNQ
jgi:hypothetical protein